jgi:hypothetical protein
MEYVEENGATSEEETMILSELYYTSQLPDLLTAEDETLVATATRLDEEEARKEASSSKSPIITSKETIQHIENDDLNPFSSSILADFALMQKNEHHEASHSETSTISLETLMTISRNLRNAEKSSSLHRHRAEDSDDVDETTNYISTSRYFSERFGERTVRPKQCHLCGNEGHLRADCPQNICYNCQRTGHVARDCKEPRKNRRMAICYRCGCTGHHVSECPDQWRKYIPIVKEGQRPTLEIASRIRHYCYNCGGSDHLGDYCSESRMDFSFGHVQTAFHEGSDRYLLLSKEFRATSSTSESFNQSFPREMSRNTSRNRSSSSLSSSTYRKKTFSTHYRPFYRGSYPY